MLVQEPCAKVEGSLRENVSTLPLLPSGDTSAVHGQGVSTGAAMSSQTCTTGCTSATTTLYQNQSAFREAERKYKWDRTPQCTSKGKQLKVLQQNIEDVDLTEVIDVRDRSRNTMENNASLHVLELPPLSCSCSSSSSLGPSSSTETLPGAGSHRQCLTCDAIPGLYIFPACITEEEQAALCREAILEYGNSSYYDNMLSTHVKHPRTTSCYQPPMRWITLGFDYQWTSKTYEKDSYSRFPPLVKDVMMRLAEGVFQAEAMDTHAPSEKKKSQPSIYQPQSGIVNYFPVGTSMMAHQDAAEEALTQPLLSLSLGCSCIFLMGTESMLDTPKAFLLRSGDLAAFAGPSRLCYHSVARILNDVPSYLTIPEESWSALEKKRIHQFCYYHHWHNPQYQEALDMVDNDKGTRVGTHLRTTHIGTPSETPDETPPMGKKGEVSNKGLASEEDQQKDTAGHARNSSENHALPSKDVAVDEGQTNPPIRRSSTTAGRPPQSSKAQQEKMEKKMKETFVMLDPSKMSEEERERYWRLAMRHMRININVRQVYAEPCDFLFSKGK